MTKKRLFDDRDQWTNMANVISDDLFHAMKPIIDKYANAGYSIRDISYVATSTLADLIVSRAIEEQMNAPKVG